MAELAAPEPKLTVRRTRGGNYSIFYGAYIVEGGFFSKRKAEAAVAELERAQLADDIEVAERKAGWDPNP